MASISHALASADALRYHLDCESKHERHQAVTPDEISEGQAAKATAVNALKSSIGLIENTLSALRKAAPPKTAKVIKPTTRAPVRLSKASRKAIKPRAAARAPIMVAAAAGATGTPVENIKQAMTAQGLKPTVQSLEDMAKAIGPIIDNFDSILTKPYLGNYNATLNTVPVVGLKNNQIMYIETKQDLNPLGSGIKDVWSTFGSIPADATIKEGDKVFMFPYKGDFCLSIGRAVWKRAHLDAKDPALSSAVDNWPNMYVKEWVKLGDDVLPAADLLGVVPFAVLSADRTQIAFQLVVLASDRTLHFLTADTLGPNSPFDELKYVPGTGTAAQPPKLDRIAYWNNNIVGYDVNSTTWNLTTKFQEGTYTAADDLKVAPITEMTATDVGVIGLRADGYLYKRVLEAPADSDSDATLKWTRWIKQDGVSNLGVASPGVILDLNVLTRTLRSRYIEVQTAVYPVVDKIRAWGITHSSYLSNLQKDAETWNNSDSTDEQRALAIKNGKAFVSHAKVWGMIISRSIGGAKESVNIMTKQLHDVRTQLETQLQLLRDKLKGLQYTLEQQKEALSKLNAAFWGAVAATFLGLAIAVIGVITMNPWVLAGAGVLFVGGIIAMVALSAKISELAKNISDTESQIRTVNIAIEELSSIVKNFQDLDGLYGTLNQFWGRMANDASAIKTMDEATAFQIGEDILADTSSIDASLEMTNQMTNACVTYLDVLNKQGIKIPTTMSAARASGISAPSMMMAVVPPSALCASVSRAKALAPEPSNLTLDTQFHEIVAAGQERLVNGDLEGYKNIMTHAAMISMAASSERTNAMISTGLWLDVPALQSSGSVWSNSFSSSVTLRAHTGTLSSEVQEHILSQGQQISGSLDSVRPHIIGMLSKVVELGETIQGWTKEYPNIPTEEQTSEVAAIQQKAVAKCEEAQHYAALANNEFAEFNHRATQFQQDLETKINGTSDEMEAQKRAADEDMRHINPPWYVYLGGAIAVNAYTETEKRKIADRVNEALNNLNNTMNQFRELQQSGLSFNGHSQTWIEMCQKVNGNLGEVYNILSGIWGQLLEDPALYASLMKIEWGQITNNANEVLSIIGGHAPFMTSAVMAMATKSVSRSQAVPSPKSKEKAQLLSAVSPGKNLSSKLQSQAQHANEVFNKLDVLLTLPYGKDIIGYWEEGKTERKTLFDVVTGLRTEYIQMVATEYDTIQNLYSLSILQEMRAQNVVKGKLPLDVFIKVTLQSVTAALRAATNTSKQFGDASKEFDQVMSVIEANINEIEGKIKTLDDNIETAEKKLRDQIIWVVADVIAMSFATAVLLVSFGFLGPVGATIALAAKIGATAAMTAASVKLVLDSMSLADVAKTIASLKATRGTLSTSVDNLKAVQPLFKDVVTGVNELTEMLTDMKSTLDKTMDNMSILGQFSLDAEDVKVIGASWGKVRDDAQVWMDVINAQGISPVTFSVRN